MKSKPKPRKGAYEKYWYFASERQRIFDQRAAGRPAPWTEDPILQEYKFCCVFRAADRVSQYLIRDVAYGTGVGTPEDRIFQIVAFRTFSRIETWEAVRAYLGGPPTIRALASGMFTEALEHARRTDGRLYTGAFILCAADAYGQKAKHLNHVELFRHMFVHGDLAPRILEAKSLEEIFELLRSYPLIGNFMAYQIAIDLNYSALFKFSENDFTSPGPGALRGLRKVFEDLGDYSPSEAIMWMVEHQGREFDRYRLPFKGLWGRALHAIDCQGLFCEVDKYCRVAMPELVSARKRIKKRFSPSPYGLKLFFPPRWGINERLPTDVPPDVSGRATLNQQVAFDFKHDV